MKRGNKLRFSFEKPRQPGKRRGADAVVMDDVRRTKQRVPRREKDVRDRIEVFRSERRLTNKMHAMIDGLRTRKVGVVTNIYRDMVPVRRQTNRDLFYMHLNATRARNDVGGDPLGSDEDDLHSNAILAEKQNADE